MLDLINPNNVKPQANKIATAVDILRELKQEAANKAAKKGITVTLT